MRCPEPESLVRGVEHGVAIVPVAADPVLSVRVAEEYTGADVSQFSVRVRG